MEILFTFQTLTLNTLWRAQCWGLCRLSQLNRFGKSFMSFCATSSCYFIFTPHLLGKHSRKIAKENPLSVSVSLVLLMVMVMVMCWLWVAASAGNDKLSTHFSFIFNTFDWYIEHLAHSLSNSLSFGSDGTSSTHLLRSGGAVYSIGSSHQLAGIVRPPSPRHAKAWGKVCVCGGAWQGLPCQMLWQRWAALRWAMPFRLLSELKWLIV